MRRWWREGEEGWGLGPPVVLDVVGHRPICGLRDRRVILPLLHHDLLCDSHFVFLTFPCRGQGGKVGQRVHEGRRLDNRDGGRCMSWGLMCAWRSFFHRLFLELNQRGVSRGLMSYMAWGRREALADAPHGLPLGEELFV